MTERTAIERMADSIDDAMRLGFRVYKLQGAELDWVRDAIRENAKLRSHGESENRKEK